MNGPEAQGLENVPASEQQQASGYSPAAEPSTVGPEREPAAAPDEAKAVERQRTVPYGALAEERARRKELQREVQEAAATRQRLQERLDALHVLAGHAGGPIPHAGTGEEGDVAPAFGDTPLEPPGAEAESAFRTQVLQSVRSYATERPDFMNAYQHAREARIAELAALGYAPDEAMAITFDNELEVIRNAFFTGRNPAQLIYDFAVQRGYRTPGGQGEDLPNAPSHLSIGQPAGGVSRMSEAEKVALAARGQAGAKSLSAAGGGATGTLTLEALAGMSDDEFAEATKGERWQRLLRG